MFYKNVLNDDEPHLLTTLALGASEGVFINGILEIPFAYYFGMLLNMWLMIGIVVLIIGLNYLYFHRTGRAKEIVKIKPMFFSNHLLSKYLTILFFIITTSFIFWEPVLIKQMIVEYNRCHVLK